MHGFFRCMQFGRSLNCGFELNYMYVYVVQFLQSHAEGASGAKFGNALKSDINTDVWKYRDRCES